MIVQFLSLYAMDQLSLFILWLLGEEEEEDQPQFT